ncbi:crossover junction endodeoxyribonuclease RuvC [Azospirillaceae bacterium]
MSFDHHQVTETELGSESASLLALDLGTHTGWALRSHNGIITSGTVLFRPGRFEGAGMAFLRFGKWLDEMAELAQRLDVVVFEEVRGHTGTLAAQVYGGFLAHLTAWCEHKHVPYQGVPVATIKKHATGKGNAGKEVVIAAMEALGHKPTDDNEADALAILHWALAQGLGGRQ